jgi:ParB family chromosome partitioning protein
MRIAAEGLSVRQTEELVRSFTAHPAARATPVPTEADPRLLQIEEALADALATRVRIQRARRKGKVIIEFGSKADLDRIAARIIDGS